MPLRGALAVVGSFFTGRLRRRFFADVREYGEELDAPRIVAAGYICLASAIGLMIGAIAVLVRSPEHIESPILSVLIASGCLHGFSEIGRRRDPRPMLGWLVMAFLIAAAVISYFHSGILAPAVWSLPAVAAIIALHLQARMRFAALTLMLAVLGFVLLTSSAVIGIPTTFTSQDRSILTFLTLVFSMTTLSALAWIANLSRDYAVEQIKAANAAITEAAARSRIALETAKVGLWDVPDTELRKFHLSESFESITGYTAEEFNDIFTALDHFVHPDDIVPLREAFALARKRLTRLRVDFRMMTKARGYRWFSARARYVRNEDGTTSISGSLQDINFIKAAEEALRAGRDQAREANQAKSDFIAVMSHEVRTPLNAILGSVEMLKRREHDPAAAELVGMIDDAGRGLLSIVNDLLDVSKIEAGKLEIALSPADLESVVTRSVDFWRGEASRKKLELTTDVSQAIHDVVLVDAGRIRQIIGNLVSNAVKFTDRGAIRTSLAMTDAADGRVAITITVSDTGPGVPENIAEAIFAPFEQGPSSARRGGAGLGLFISRRLARLMGGELQLAKSGPGGAQFRFTLEAARSASPIPGEEDPDADPMWPNRTVLVVDDNAANRRIADLLLSRFGLKVATCSSGLEAIDLCTRETFDAILMDIVMPGLDGVETLQRLRNDPDGCNQATPAIALTARLAADDIAAYAASGFDGVAGKPVNVVELAQAIAPFMVET